MSDTRLLLTCGLPGAGKTTRAKELAEQRRAVRLTSDEWLWALGSTPWDSEVQQRVEHQLWRLTSDLLRLGQSVVLDLGLWARSERDDARTVARELGVGVELHLLDPPLEVLWRRIEARNKEAQWTDRPIERVELEQWSMQFERPDAAELSLFDRPFSDE